jgi:Stress responsive A/B Barrel Domain
MIAHIVLFSAKDGLDEVLRRAFAQSVVETMKSIPSVRSARIGMALNVDPGHERQMGDATYEFAAVIEFDDRTGLVAYLNDPRHAELGRLFWTSCQRTVVSEVEYIDLDSPEAIDLMVK